MNPPNNSRRAMLLGLGVVAAVPGCASVSPAPAGFPAAAPASSPPAPAVPMSTSPSIRIHTQLNAICNHAQKPLASLAAAAVSQGKLVYSGGFGRARMGDAGARPAPDYLAAPDTLYRIASISKLLTSLGVMRLVERKVLDLDADCSRYLGWSLRNPAFPNAPVTLRHMLSHTSGLRDDAGYFWPQGEQLKDVVTPGGKHFGKGQAWSSRAPSGAYFQYANLPWGLIGQVMECATQTRFDRLMQRELFEPLGMDGGFNPAEMPAAQLARLATLYRKRSTINGREVWNPLGPWVPQVDDYSAAASVNRATDAYVIGSNGVLFGPQGNARASAEGLAKLAQTMMNLGTTPEGKAYLKPETLKLLLQRQWTYTLPASGSNYDGLMLAWGLGNQHFLDTSRVEGGKPVGDRLIQAGGFLGMGHLGNAWGLTSALVFNPLTQQALVFLIGGPSFNPDAIDPGQYLSLYGYEEKILTALALAV